MIVNKKDPIVKDYRASWRRGLENGNDPIPEQRNQSLHYYLTLYLVVLTYYIIQ